MSRLKPGSEKYNIVMVKIDVTFSDDLKKLAFVLDNVINDKECKPLIE